MTHWLPVWLPRIIEDQKGTFPRSGETPSDLRRSRVELRGFEPRTSCMPWEMRKFNCRPMPARYGPYRSSRTGHAWNDGQMTVKTILEQPWITPIPAGRNRQSGKVPARHQAGATHARTVTTRETPIVVRFAPNADSARSVKLDCLPGCSHRSFGSGCRPSSSPTALTVRRPVHGCLVATRPSRTCRALRRPGCVSCTRRSSRGRLARCLQGVARRRRGIEASAARGGGRRVQLSRLQGRVVSMPTLAARPFCSCRSCSPAP